MIREITEENETDIDEFNVDKLDHKKNCPSDSYIARRKTSEPNKSITQQSIEQYIQSLPESQQEARTTVNQNEATFITEKHKNEIEISKVHVNFKNLSNFEPQPLSSSKRQKLIKLSSRKKSPKRPKPEHEQDLSLKDQIAQKIACYKD